MIVTNGTRRAVFLDKDGTVVVNIPNNVEPSRIRLTRNAGAGLRLLHEAGFLLVIVSNQPGAAHGLFPETALGPVRTRLDWLFQEAGARLDGFYYCPHHPDGTVPSLRQHCHCRKPGPGLLFQAAEELRIDLWGSWMVGDILDDVEAGRRAGCQSIFLDVGNETEWVLTPERKPHYVTTDILAAARQILRASRQYEPAIRERGAVA